VGAGLLLADVSVRISFARCKRENSGMKFTSIKKKLFKRTVSQKRFCLRLISHKG